MQLSPGAPGRGPLPPGPPSLRPRPHPPPPALPGPGAACPNPRVESHLIPGAADGVSAVPRPLCWYTSPVESCATPTLCWYTSPVGRVGAVPRPLSAGTLAQWAGWVPCHALSLLVH